MVAFGSNARDHPRRKLSTLLEAPTASGYSSSCDSRSLVDLDARLSLDDFRQVLAPSKGDMPAFPQLSMDTRDSVYAYLVNPEGKTRGPRPAATTAVLGGPVVASGGAPGGLVLAKGSGKAESNDYPAGVTAPPRLYSDYGLEYPFVIAPPWSWLVAYDLNKGTIRWKVPLGDDPELAAAGVKSSGIPQGGERRGMVVTSAGLIFVNCKDSKLRAFDADTGKVLWSSTLPTGTEGIPSM